MPSVELIRPSAEEYRDLVAAEIRAALGLDVDEFVGAYVTGAVDEADPEVARIAALLGLGQNGR